VLYRTDAVDLSWLPDDVPVVLVHNDDREVRVVDEAHGREVVRVEAGGNAGFGGGVNLALPHVRTARIVLVNPDASLQRHHWPLLAGATDDEVVTLSLRDASGGATSVANRYPTPMSLLATALRLGRLAPRGSRRRDLLSRLLGSWGRDHVDLTGSPDVRLPLSTHWGSGAVLSLPTGELAAVGGFDERYFLYLEDADLCARLARQRPDLTLVVHGVADAFHHVHGSASSAGSTNLHLTRSALLWASQRPGSAWLLARFGLAALFALRRLRLRTA
jgi:N-acetylglucosaminyl-diphospho-decaprenol L-rhamnosyltransferase